MASTVISIPADEELPLPKNIEEKERPKFSILAIICHLRVLEKSNHDMRKLIHSVKVGIALVLVSLLYLLDPFYEQVGENAIWAIMTVVVMFEFYAGATLSKGLNRGLGTILGGVLGCSAANFAQEVGGMGKVNVVIIGSLVFFFGVAATYARLVPSIKKRCDYGAMIFILTFNLVIVSGLRAETVSQLARHRLSTIGMGFAVCIFISLLVFPTWASDELHAATAHKFQDLADSIEGCFENYFRILDNENLKDEQPSDISGICKSVLHSKSKDESLANFAEWEPWHGKFGLYYPWKKYLQVGELLRELATIVISLKGCLQSPRQPSSSPRSIIEPSEAVGLTLAWSLRELGESVMKMRRSQQEAVMVPKLKSMRLKLSSIVSPTSKFGPLENVDGLAIASFVFLLTEMVEKIEELAKEVEELGDLAGFHTK